MARIFTDPKIPEGETTCEVQLWACEWVWQPQLRGAENGQWVASEVGPDTHWADGNV